MLNANANRIMKITCPASEPQAPDAPLITMVCPAPDITCPLSHTEQSGESRHAYCTQNVGQVAINHTGVNLLWVQMQICQTMSYESCTCILMHVLTPRHESIPFVHSYHQSHHGFASAS